LPHRSHFRDVHARFVQDGLRTAGAASAATETDAPWKAWLDDLVVCPNRLVAAKRLFDVHIRAELPEGIKPTIVLHVDSLCHGCSLPDRGARQSSSEVHDIRAQHFVDCLQRELETLADPETEESLFRLFECWEQAVEQWQVRVSVCVPVSLPLWSPLSQFLTLAHALALSRQVFTCAARQECHKQ
jgi:hypothetical protein